MTNALIRQRVDDWARTVGARDIDRLMSFYAPSVVSFDIDGPLRYAGPDDKRRAWENVFATYATIRYEVRELSIMAEGDLAITHAVNRVSGTLTSGRAAGMWVRGTMGLRRIDGAWLIVHDHVSVPADLEHRQALLDLVP